jgi:hypothetical protein
LLLRANDLGFHAKNRETEVATRSDASAAASKRRRWCAPMLVALSAAAACRRRRDLVMTR